MTATHLAFSTVRAGLLYMVPPLAFMALILCGYIAGEPYLTRIVTSPTGFQELVCGVILLCAFVLALRCLWLPSLTQQRSLRGWLVVYAIAMFYYMGEDQNWGQYLFDLAVPDYFVEKNKEQEINLHNMSSWFNQKPRLLVECWVWVACILVPLGWSGPRRALRKRVPDVLWPDARIVASAVLAASASWPERIGDVGFPAPAFWHAIRFSELQEVFYAYVMLLYVWFLLQRLRG